MIIPYRIRLKCVFVAGSTGWIKLLQYYPAKPGSVEYLRCLSRRSLCSETIKNGFYNNNTFIEYFMSLKFKFNYLIHFCFLIFISLKQERPNRTRPGANRNDSIHRGPQNVYKSKTSFRVRRTPRVLEAGE